MAIRNRQFGTTADAMKHYQVSRPTIHRWVREGIVPARRVGKRLLRVELIDLAEFGERVPAVTRPDEPLQQESL